MPDATPFFKINSYTIPATYPRFYPQALVDPNIISQLSVRQWTPTSNLSPSPGDPTFIFAGGIGVVKEVYEPFFQDLTLSLNRQSIQPRAFWMADPITTAASALLNASNLGNEHHSFDHALDIFMMIQHFAQRQLMPQPLIGLAECFGSTQLAYLSSVHPGLFTSLTFIDPPLNLQSGVGDIAQALAWRLHVTSRRHEYWPTLAEAEQSITRNAHYKDWDQRYVSLLLQHHFCPISHSPSTEIPSDEIYRLAGTGYATTTPRAQEINSQWRPRLTGEPIEEWGRNGGFEFNATHPDEPRTQPSVGDVFRPWYPLPGPRALHKLRDVKCPVLFVSCEKSIFSLPGDRQARLNWTGTGLTGSGGLKKGMVEEYEVKGADHDAMFNVKFMAEVVHATSEFVGRKVQRWREMEVEMERWRNEKTRVEQTTGDPRVMAAVDEWRPGKDIREIMKRKLEEGGKAKM